MVQFPKDHSGRNGCRRVELASGQTVSKLGQLGVVSGTALDSLFVRRLADGDLGGHMRRGLDAFPFPEMARRIWQEYFTPGGKPSGTPYPTMPMHQHANLRAS